MSALGWMAMHALLIVPASATGLLAWRASYRVAARLNVGAALISLLAALILLGARPEANLYLRVDDFNIYLIILNNLVSFTTSLFSASYIAHELETGRLTPAYLRFYHAMYQALLFAMNLALLANNIGLLWVAIELATLITVLMVGLYRTRAALGHPARTARRPEGSGDVPHRRERRRLDRREGPRHGALAAGQGDPHERPRQERDRPHHQRGRALRSDRRRSARARRLRNAAETLLYTTDAALEGYVDLVDADTLEDTRESAKRLRTLVDSQGDNQSLRSAYKDLEARTFQLAE